MNKKIYRQCDGVVMGSFLEPVIARIFMVELKKSLIPTLIEHISPWKRYVDDTMAVIKLSSIEHVLSILSSSHQNIEFTYELEEDGKINFEQGHKIIKSLNDYVKRLLSQNHTSQHAYKSRKLGSGFEIKD